LRWRFAELIAGVKLIGVDRKLIGAAVTCSSRANEALKLEVFSAREVHKSFPGWRLQIWLALMLSAPTSVRSHVASIGLIAIGGKNRAGNLAGGRGFSKFLGMAGESNAAIMGNHE
jgi:hypothetical protein